jgi:hypothetical protein
MSHLRRAALELEDLVVIPLQFFLGADLFGKSAST